MAGWLSSRLKAAEQILQQLDQQAAVSLQKQEKDHANALNSAEVGNDGQWPNRDKQYSTSKRLEVANLPSQAVSGKSRHTKSAQAPPGAGRNSQDGAGFSKQDDFGKQDWTELLGSVDVSPSASASRSISSIGSSDHLGSQSAHKGGSQRLPHLTGKGGVTMQQTIGLRPAPRTGSGLAQNPPAQASRTKVPISHIVDPRPSELLQKIDGNQEDDNGPRRLEFGEQPVEGTGDYDPIEHQSLGAVSHTNDLGIGGDPFLQPVNQDGEFTELELSVPEDKKGLVDGSSGEGADISSVEQDVPLATGSLLPTPPLIHVVKEEIGVTETSSVGDAVPVIDENEMHRGEDWSGESSLEEGMKSGVVTEDVGDSHAMAEEQVPKHTVEIIEEGSDGDDGDGESAEESDLSDLSESEDESQSGSESESDSEYEERARRKRERRQEIAELRAARVAAEEATRATIREREAFVAKLEQEKENLEQLLAEWEERQAKEAEELNLNMKEVSEAVEIEKQRHSATRREGLAQEAQLEAKNQELAKSLAAAERNLEDEMARVAVARSKVEAREIIHSDLERKIAGLQLCLRPPSQPQELQESKSERETAEEHYSELAARLEQYQIKAKELEENISIASDAHYTPSVMELELETRLNQLTDHLIQKQAQVEALSTEKATLHFRLEAITNTLREEKSAAQSRATKRSKGVNMGTDWSAYDDDLEYGLSKPYSSKDKNLFISTDPDTILNQTSGSHPLRRLVRQMDMLFLEGAKILRTSGSARALAGLYIFLLHWWVLFILFMHMRSGNSGAVSGVSVQAGVNTLSSLTAGLNSTSLSQR